MTIPMDDSDFLSEDKFDKMSDFEASVVRLSPDNREDSERCRMLAREEFQLNDDTATKG
jgi:hypothetical protein